VRSWHTADDEDGAFDCFVGIVRGDFLDTQLVKIWCEALGQERPSKLLAYYLAWMSKADVIPRTAGAGKNETGDPKAAR
jgi:molybdopterin synthase catalytic subunit